MKDENTIIVDGYALQRQPQGIAVYRIHAAGETYIDTFTTEAEARAWIKEGDAR